MQIVIDANIVMSMLIRPGITVELLYKEELEVFAPDFLLKELEDHREEIIRKSNLTEEEVERFYCIIKKRIKFIPCSDFSYFYNQAAMICPHEKDIIYFAMALYIRCPLWTNEKKLRKQNKIEIYATHELMSLFGMTFV